MAARGNIKPVPMTESALKAAVSAEIKTAQGHNGGELSHQRRQAMELYYGEPLGNEVEGRSAVVLSDTMDTVEWIMPALMKLFFSGTDAVKFDPVGQEDEDSAAQKTDYCNHVFLKDNDGFLLTYDWFKDALLQKTGILKCEWDSTPVTKRSTHRGLTVLELGELLETDEKTDIEVVEQNEYMADPEEEDEAENEGLDGMEDGGAVPMMPQGAPMPPPGTAPMMGQPALPPGAAAMALAMFGGDIPEDDPDSLVRYDVTILRTDKRGRINIVCVPPEEFLISRRATSADDAGFTGHRYRITVSEARERGFDEEDIESSVGKTGEGEYNEERIARHDVDEEYLADDPASLDPAQRSLWIIEGYFKIDFDGDGISEMRQIITAGENNSVILSNEEIDDHPWITINPIRIPHKFNGLGMADLVGDLQKIRTTVLRQMLDNMYNMNSGRAFISQAVNMDDWLSNRPNQAVRVKLQGNGDSVMQHAQPIQNSGLGAFAQPLMEFLDSEKIGRTGVNKYQQGLDVEALNKTASGSARIMAAANSRIELIARLFAEMGFVKLFRRIALLTVENQDKARTIRLRNDWVDIDPKSWSEGMDTTVQVGLGYDTKEQEAVMVQQLIAIQEKAMQYQGGLDGPMVFPEHLHNSFERFVKAGGFRNVDSFFEDPRSKKGQQAWEAMKNRPQQPSPEMMKLQGEQQLQQAKMQMEGQRIQLDAQRDQAETANQERKYQAEIMLAREKAAAEIQVARERAQAEMQLAVAKAESEINIEREKMGLRREELTINARIKQTEIETRAAIDREKMTTDAQIRDRESERSARATVMASRAHFGA